MPEDYLQLEAMLKAVGLPCAENAWNTRPTGAYITYALEFEVGADYGDNRKVARAWAGSVDLYAEKKRGGTDQRGAGYVQLIEAALTECCGGRWQMETKGTWERETGLFHYEWSFEVGG